MGCGESKIKEISLSPDSSEGGRSSASSNPTKEKLKEADEGLPNRLLAAVPVSDLGDSLDSRHLGESLNISHYSTANNNGGPAKGKGRHSDSADSGGNDSADSGYDEYEEDYSFIITENSPPDMVRSVEAGFRPVDLPELLVITGRACARILSGYQKTKQEESRILDNLREEGLLAKPKTKTAGGMSFEVVDAAIVEETLAAEHPDEDAFNTQRFMPKRKLEKLEHRRENIRKPSANMSARLAEAEERRRQNTEEKMKQVLERSGVERYGRMRSASALRRENRYSEAVTKRQSQLQEMRDKLKEKHKKNDMVRLKAQLASNVELESGLGSQNQLKDGFFDD